MSVQRVILEQRARAVEGSVRASADAMIAIAVAIVACVVLGNALADPLVVVLALVGLRRHRLTKRLRRMRAKGAEVVLAHDARPPILYLRPFAMDGTYAKRAWLPGLPVSEETYEEWLTRCLRRIGPVITVGDPSEGIPQLGAARVYASDDEWRRLVDALLAQAGTIILQTGVSAGLAWEVARVVESDDSERLMLSLPLGTARSRELDYAAFRARFASFFPAGIAAARRR